MSIENAIIERVETFVLHPVFAGSDRAVGLILNDLESLERCDRIGQATYRRLRELILRSPHVAS